MSRFITIKDGTYIEEIECMEECKWRINNMCCKESSKYLGDDCCCRENFKRECFVKEDGVIDE